MSTLKQAYMLVEHIDINQDMVAITVEPTAQELGIRHLAGQYVMSYIQDFDFPLSIANAPRDDKRLIFVLRHNQHQPQAQIFLHYLKENQHLALSQAMGKMHMAESDNEQQPIILLAGGTGMAPFQAILEDLWQKQDNRLNQVKLYWGVRKQADLYLARYLQNIQAKFPGFKYSPILSDAHKASNWTGLTGWVYDKALLDLSDDQIEKATVYASGPYAMIQNSLAAFQTRGLARKQFISDMLND